MPIHVEDPVVKRELVRSDVHEQVLAGSIYPVTMTEGSALSADGSSLRLNLSVARASRCESTRVDTWQTKTTTVRESKAGVMLTLGALAMPLLVAGLVSNARGKPLSPDKPNGSTELTGTGTMVLVGALIGPPFLLEGSIDAVRSIDSVDTEDDTDIHKEFKACHPVSAANVPISLIVDGEVASTRRTSAEGKASFELLRGELSKPPHEIRLAAQGSEAALAPELSSLLQTTVQRFGVNSLGPTVADASLAQAPEVPPVAVEKLVPPSGPSLFDVALATSKRESFEQAVSSHGCSRVRIENRNVSHYDIGCLKLPGFDRMKVLYDANSRVVRVKYSGKPSADRFANMQQALIAEYGPPQTKSHDEATWRLPGGFSLALTSDFFGGAELLYVNLALDAELQRAVEQQERQKVDELQHKHGTAF